ncbi:MAG: nuclear transport factor 2 family protein [Anaerolineae bacterium]|nr:nuclear transport factor 2 family protein [Anaerolineae bacterium]
MMYHQVVRRIIQGAFRHLNQHNPEQVVAMFAPTLIHSFAGESALGGVRSSPETSIQWYQRLFRLFPDLRFKVNSIVIAGQPWDTRAAIQFRVELTPPYGGHYSNEVAQFIRIRWGRITELYLYEDTHKLEGLLSQMAQAGIAEAAAAPIVG